MCSSSSTCFCFTESTLAALAGQQQSARQLASIVMFEQTQLVPAQVLIWHQ
jgi:hypothetical protein